MSIAKWHALFSVVVFRRWVVTSVVYVVLFMDDFYIDLHNSTVLEKNCEH